MWLLALCALFLSCKAGDQSGSRPNIVLIIVDALRADHVGAYGYPLPTTPVIDELARTGRRFDIAISQSSWTLPSLMSLFTSRHPPELPAHSKNLRRSFALDEAETTLAERLRDAGYRTVSITTNPYTVDQIFRLMQGFDEKVFKSSAPANWVVDNAIEKLDALRNSGKEQPFFLYLHLMDVHTPYVPPAPFDSMFATLDDTDHVAEQRDPPGVRGLDELATPAFVRQSVHTLALYDGALRFADTEIGRLLTYLASRGLRDSTVVAIAADHGEAFWDRVGLEQEFGLHSHGKPEHFGVGHGHTLFQELVLVPLILNGPGVPSGTDPAPARNLDIAPTLLTLSRIDFDAAASDGIDLLRRSGEDTPAALSETMLAGHHQLSLLKDDRQIVRIDDAELLFDTSRRPWVRLTDEEKTLAALSGALDSQLGTIRRASFREGSIDAQTVESLRALGYLE